MVFCRQHFHKRACFVCFGMYFFRLLFCCSLLLLLVNRSQAQEITQDSSVRFFGVPLVFFSSDTKWGGEPAPTKSAGGWPEISVCKAALSAVQEAWNRGAPWSPHARSRTEGRFAIENISRALGLEMKTAEMMVFEWQRNDVLRFEVHDPKTKSKGLRVAQWPDWSGGNVGGNTSPGRKHDA